MTEDQERKAVIIEAKTWVGTTWHHMGRRKITKDSSGKTLDAGAVDCAQSVAMIYHNAMPHRIPLVPLEPYPMQWFLHRDVERYLEEVFKHAHEIKEEQVKTADLVVFKYGRTYAHGAIVAPPGLPNILHADRQYKCFIAGLTNNGALAGQERRYFTLWGTGG